MTEEKEKVAEIYVPFNCWDVIFKRVWLTVLDKVDQKIKNITLTEEQKCKN